MGAGEVVVDVEVEDVGLWFDEVETEADAFAGRGGGVFECRSWRSGGAGDNDVPALAVLEIPEMEDVFAVGLGGVEDGEVVDVVGCVDSELDLGGEGRVEVGYRVHEYCTDHAGVRNKSVAPQTDFGNGLEEAGTEVVAETECVDGGWGGEVVEQRLEFGGVALGGTHVVGHAVGEDVQALDVAEVGGFFEYFEAGFDAGPEVGGSVFSEGFDALLQGLFVGAGHFGEGVDGLISWSGWTKWDEGGRKGGMLGLTSAWVENVTSPSRSFGPSVSMMVSAACLTRSRMLKAASSVLSCASGRGAGSNMLPETSITRTMSHEALCNGWGQCGGLME